MSEYQELEASRAGHVLPSLSALTDAEFTALTQDVLAGRSETITQWWQRHTCEHNLYHDISTPGDPFQRLCATCGRHFRVAR